MRFFSSPVRAVSLALTFASTFAVGCFQPWPGRPPKLAGETKPPVEGDEAILAKFRGSGGKHPTKAYWIAEPQWLPVRSPLGIVTGRYTDSVVIAMLTRYDGSPDGWPDLCEYREVSLKEVATNPEATTFAKTEVKGESRKGEVDCAVYDAAR